LRPLVKVLVWSRRFLAVGAVWLIAYAALLTLLFLSYAP
jgi:hypothetical protein